MRTWYSTLNWPTPLFLFLVYFLHCVCVCFISKLEEIIIYMLLSMWTCFNSFRISWNHSKSNNYTIYSVYPEYKEVPQNTQFGFIISDNHGFFVYPWLLLSHFYCQHLYMPRNIYSYFYNALFSLWSFWTTQILSLLD